jgi:hypothetical protein
VEDVTHTRIGSISALEGFLDGVRMRQVASDLGVAAFGISIVEMDPNADSYPEHDHSREGIGGEMFAERPQQLGQEEIYIALAGSGTIEADGDVYPLDSDHLIRVGPAVKRKIIAGDEGLRLLALGGTAGEAYDPGGTL